MSIKQKVNKIKWLFKRWQAMDHPHEDVYRVKQFWQHHVADVYFAKPSVKFSWKHLPYELSLKHLQQSLPGKDGFKKFEFYDLMIDDLFEVKDWRRDFKNAKTSPILPTSKIDNQNFNLVGDYRYVSTLSRMHHLPIMMLGGVVNKISDSQSVAFCQLSDWKEQNPYLKSIHWKSGIEAGIRSTNLVFLRKLNELQQTADKDLENIIDRLVEEHFVFLTSHLSLFSSANNHLLFELMGIFIISLHYESVETNYWKQKSFDWLITELEKQTFEDGGSKEQSSHYHAEVMNIYATVFSQAMQSSITIPTKAILRFRKMAEVLNYFLLPNGHALPVGDSDEGQILFPYFDKSFDLYQSLLNDVDIICTGSNTRMGNTRLDIRNQLLWGNFNTNVEHISKKPLFVIEPLKLFDKSGYFFYNRNNVSLLFDAGSLGFGQLAAHGHADVLQIIMSVNGEPFLIDPGTYQYHSRFARLRNYFRGTLAHNTISINGVDQAKSGGRMIWNTKPDVNITSFENDGIAFHIEAAHNGFIKQGINVLHSRSIHQKDPGGSWIITDTLDGHSQYEIIISYHLAPHIEIDISNDTILLKGKKAAVKLKNDIFINAYILKGSDNELGGWFSPSFNNLQPTSTLRVKMNAKGSIVLTTKMDVIFF